MKWFLQRVMPVYFFLGLSLISPFEAHAGKALNVFKDGYYLYIPSAAEEGREVPILIALPGKAIEPGDDIQLWKAEAEKKGFFVIDLKVNYDFLKDDADIRSLHERITDLLKALSGSYPIDEHEVYIAGTSAGAVTSLALSLRFPNAYRTVGLVGGAVMYFSSEDYLVNARNIQFLIIHGENDPTIPTEKVYKTKSELERNGAQVLFKMMSSGEHSLSPLVYREMVDWFSEVHRSPIKKFARMLRKNLNLNVSR